MNPAASILQKEETDNLHIRSYNKEYFLLSNGEEYHTPIAILGNRLYTNLLPDSFDQLTEEHYHAWLALRPRIILLSTGDEMRFIDPKWLAFFNQRGIGIDTMPTESLCRTFTILAVEERHALGLFFPLTKEVHYLSDQQE